MTPDQEKYMLAAQEQILNTALNLHAENRATKELVILMAKGSLNFPNGQTPEGYWKACFDRAFTELSQQSKNSLLKQMK